MGGGGWVAGDCLSPFTPEMFVWSAECLDSNGCDGSRGPSVHILLC